MPSSASAEVQLIIERQVFARGNMLTTARFDRIFVPKNLREFIMLEEGMHVLDRCSDYRFTSVSVLLK